ncbi:MAG TPA: UDP-glucose 4-epimerase GalE [Ruminococcaceae bacterium]|nr:UDP-glucose 4-epimerase GalE [Oscillospiraceae bacterium]
MAILICGGAGYIGSHVNKLFAQNGYATVVYDNLSRGNREAVKWGSFIKADLADTDTLDKVFEETNIEAVVHLAAYAYVGESVTEPAKYYINNISNTLNLLEAMRRHNCDKIIFSSTCATYGIPEILPITEDMPQNPINPYGASKLMVERIFKDYARAYGLKFVVFRYFNAAGADPDGEIGENHDPETHLIPLILEAASGKRPDIKVFGTDYPTPDGSCIRDYIHVTDIAKAHLLALEYLNSDGKSEFFNLGNERGASVFEVIEAVAWITGKAFAVTAKARRDGDPPVLVGSPEKAYRVLGWKPRYSAIDDMVSHAWQWYCKQEHRGAFV